MTLRSMLTQDVTVVRVTWDALDVYGNPVPGATVSTAYKGRLEHAGAREDVADRQTVVSDWRLFLPPEAVIGPLDRVEAAGRTFEVVGLPEGMRAPRGVHHIEAFLRDIEG